MKPKTAEHRANISKALRGKKKSPEHVEKNRLAQLGKRLTEEAKQKIREALTGRPGKPRTEQWLERASRSHLGRSGLLQKYGISTDQYAAQLKAGNRWCHWAKHWMKREQFLHNAGVCSQCYPEHIRISNLKRFFGVDQQWYDAKLAEQCGVCAICESPDPQNKGFRFFAIDHDHNTDHIRGLLCMKCNQALERLETCLNWGTRARAYLERYRQAAEAGALPKAPKPFKRYVRPSKRKLKHYAAVKHGKADDAALERMGSVEDFEVAESLMSQPSGEIGVVAQ